MLKLASRQLDCRPAESDTRISARYEPFLNFPVTIFKPMGTAVFPGINHLSAVIGPVFRTSEPLFESVIRTSDVEDNRARVCVRLVISARNHGDTRASIELAHCASDLPEKKECDGFTFEGEDAPGVRNSTCRTLEAGTIRKLVARVYFDFAEEASVLTAEARHVANMLGMGGGRGIHRLHAACERKVPVLKCPYA